eukprot:gene23997-30284_t
MPQYFFAPSYELQASVRCSSVQKLHKVGLLSRLPNKIMFSSTSTPEQSEQPEFKTPDESLHMAISYYGRVKDAINSVDTTVFSSPFGDLVAQETKIDPAVRLGMECEAASMDISRTKDGETIVQPVTSGHRVTLTYSILVADKEDAEDKNEHNYRPYVHLTQTSGVHEPLTQAHPLREDISKALPTDGPIGIFLSHAYTRSGLLARNLKGSDKQLHDYLVTQNVPVSLVPVTSSYSFERYEDEYVDCNEGDADEVPEFPVRLIHGFSDPRIEAHKNLPPDMPFISGWDARGECVKDRDIPCHHAGNHVEPHSVDKIYIKGAMIVGPAPVSVPVTTVSSNSVEV